MGLFRFEAGPTITNFILGVNVHPGTGYNYLEIIKVILTKFRFYHWCLVLTLEWCLGYYTDQYKQCRARERNEYEIEFETVVQNCMVLCVPIGSPSRASILYTR